LPKRSASEWPECGAVTTFSHVGVREFINLQDVSGMAEPYQVRQLLGLTERYDLSLGGAE